MLIKYFFIFLLINQKLNAETTPPTTTTTTASTAVQSTLNLLYLEPADLESDVFTLNEKNILGTKYKQGWIFPSDEEVSLNIYLYYDSLPSNQKILQFIKNGTTSPMNIISSGNLTSSTSSKGVEKRTAQSMPLSLFFTTEFNCKGYKTESIRNFEMERLGANMYKAHLTKIRLPYSADSSLHICLQQFDMDDNFYDNQYFYAHQGTDYWVSIVTTRSLLPLWLRIALFFLLLTLSGLFSGLNLGLMSLDVNELETLQRIGTPKEQSYAAKIYPLRKRGNFIMKL
jgi:hypothetical protein